MKVISKSLAEWLCRRRSWNKEEQKSGERVWERPLSGEKSDHHSFLSLLWSAILHIFDSTRSDHEEKPTVKSSKETTIVLALASLCCFHIERDPLGCKTTLVSTQISSIITFSHWFPSQQWNFASGSQRVARKKKLKDEGSQCENV